LSCNPEKTFSIVIMLQEFKNFVLRGNVIDLAVGVLIGGAFGTIVKAVTDGIIAPLIALLGGDPNVSLKLWVFDIGLVINALISFLIMAAVLFFVFVKPVNKLMAMTKKPEAPAAPPAKPDDVKLLEEIRDLLRK
jgi:large conductance mechanosensitive channel